MRVHSFRAQTSQATLDDLRKRLARTQWPDEVEGADWDYGADLAYMRGLAAYWNGEFDWRAQEGRINGFANFRADVDGFGVHFIHERGRGPAPAPLILTHGWPGTFLEMLNLIPRLTDPARFGADPADAFDVVVPSLPGYGFSDRPLSPGPWKVHDVWARLMSGLGYERFGAYGSDFGAGITTDLGWLYPERVIGIYVTTASDLAWPYPLPAASELSGEERDFLARIARWDEDEGGYRHEQRTRPQTLAYGLADSPVGLAAWIVEKLRAWSDCDGDVERRFTKDEILAIATLYWVTGTINSSMRDYYERRSHPELWRRTRRIEIPTAVAMFPKDFPFPREWAERSYNLQRWTVIPHGGHFPAHEEPDLLAEDIRSFFRELRRGE